MAVISYETRVSRIKNRADFGRQIKLAKYCVMKLRRDYKNAELQNEKRKLYGEIKTAESVLYKLKLAKTDRKSEIFVNLQNNQEI